MHHLISIPILSVMQNVRRCDIGILTGIYENRIQLLDPVFIFITNTAAVIAFGLPVLLLLFSFKTKNAGIRRNALMILVPVILSAIIANILKYTFDMPRPYEIYPFIVKLSSGGSPSFPSGHTTDAFAFAIAVSLVYSKWYIVIPVLIWASLVGYSRMCLGVHFPTDVLVGAIIGFACSYGYISFIRKKYLKSAKA